MKRFTVISVVLLTAAVLFGAGTKERPGVTEKEDELVTVTMLIDNGQALEGFNAVAKAAEK